MKTTNRTPEDHMIQADRQRSVSDDSQWRRRELQRWRRLGSRLPVFSVFALVQLLALFTFAAALFAQQLYWAKSVGGTSSDQGFEIAVDSFGNSYVTSFFVGTATFSSAPLVQLTAPLSGSK